MNNKSPFKKIFESRSDPMPETPQPTEPMVKEDTSKLEALPTPNSSQRKRGRPATGKRSDDAWIGRTYYVKRETDLDVESELLKLRRQGIEVDKSELVDFLMAVWVKWQQGENIDLRLDEFTPRRKDKTDGK